MGYDACLLGAVLFFATALALPVTGGQAVAAGNPWYSAYLLLTSYGYFAWQWGKGGQTLGMRAWRVRLATSTGARPARGRLALRFLLACLSLGALGAGFFWALLDRDGLAFHDRFSGTALFRIG